MKPVMQPFRRTPFAPGALLLFALSAPGAAQEPDTSLIQRPLATRDALESLAGRLERSGDAAHGDALARLRARLDQGDFDAGDRIVLEVQGEPALSDTFDVWPGPELVLPPPATGRLPLRGVLRSELEPRLTEFVQRFIHDAAVRARPLMRLSIQGEVVRAGYHEIPADATLADALSAAGGTTSLADTRKLRLERDGDAVHEGEELERLIAQGGTLDEARLRDGDQLVVPRRKEGGIQENLRFLWIVVSLAGGIYGLSRAF